MILMNDVLKASKGIHVDDTFAELWGRKLSNAYTVATYTGTFPAVLQTVAGYLAGYKIYGNTVQGGTPTPENPIMPSGCGERTGNLWDFQPSVKRSGVTLTWNGAKIVFSGLCTSSANLSKTITLSSGTYTIKANANRIPLEDNNSCVDVYNARPFLMASVANRNATNGIANFTLGEETTLQVRIRIQAGVNYDGFTLEPMLNLGSTALPYEPYGYKLPLTSAGQDVDIYLGESQTTRRIKKLVLTGTDADGIWVASTARAGSFYTSIGVNGIIGAALCDRAVNAKTLADYNYGNIYVEKSGISVIINLWLFNAAITLTDFRSYLAAQYANGTPVTVWYVLAEPETGIVNEPLMKIGDYADTIDSTQTSVQIPTAAGSTTISWAGGLAPSEVELTYRKPKGQ